MKVKPLGRRVLLRLIEDKETKSPGGIVLPEAAKSEKALRGEVLAVGTGEKIQVKRGDVVLVPRHGGTELERDREKLLIVKATDILAVVKET
jgi:chaperonin GroES